MVGWLGGCCCTQTPPIWTCSESSFFEDDFSPTWDSSWTFVQDIATANGKLIVFNETAVTAYGALFRIANKETIQGDINGKVKLDNWQNSFSAGLSAYAGIGIGNVYLSAYNQSNSANPPLNLQLNYYQLTINNVVVNQFIGNPQTGDTMQLRLSNFVELTPSPFPYNRALSIGKVEVIINGTILYTHQNTYPFPIYEPCYSFCKLDIYQPSFVIWGSGWKQIRLDDYYLNCE